jgi:DNA-binding transcriptional regulator GbsR (MarR family)
MQEKQELFFYKGRIKEIEEALVQYVVDVGKTKRSKMDSHLLAYLLFHPKLSQAQMRALSKKFYLKKSKSGISTGRISSFVNKYEKFRVLHREKEKSGRNYTYFYSFRGTLTNLTMTALYEGIGMIHEMIDFFAQKIESLTNLNSKQKNNSVFPIVLSRTKELINFWREYEDMVKDLKKSFPDIPQTTSIRGFFKEIEDYSADLRLEDIEEEIIKALTETTGFTVKNDQYTRILSYFIIRKKLTQGDIKKLTGYSTGYISQALNYLIENELIQKVKIKGVRKPFYVVESIKYNYYLRFYNRLNLTFNKKPVLDELLRELRENEDKLKDLNGYTFIRTRLEELLEYFPLVEEFIEILNTELEKLKKT